jgi:hypothetical protein
LEKIRRTKCLESEQVKAGPALFHVGSISIIGCRADRKRFYPLAQEKAPPTGSFVA